MQRAQLQIDHQHARRRIGAHRLLGDPQRRHGGRAAHEPDQRARHVRPQPEPLGQLQVEPGRGEAGAGRDDQMGDARPLVADARARRPPRSASASACGSYSAMRAAVPGNAAALVEPVGIHLAGFQVARAQDGHSDARCPTARPCGRTRRVRCSSVSSVRAKAMNGRVDVVRRHRRADAVDMRACVMPRAAARSTAFSPPNAKELDIATSDRRAASPHSARSRPRIPGRVRESRSWAAACHGAAPARVTAHSIAPPAFRQWPTIDLVDDTGNRARCAPNTSPQRRHLGLVVQPRAGAVRVDVIDLIGRHAAHRPTPPASPAPRPVASGAVRSPASALMPKPTSSA